MKLPPAVEVGLLKAYEWNTLWENVERNDVNGFATYARELCRGNYPLFNHVFLGYQVTEHFQRVRRMTKGHNKVLLRLPRSHSKSWEFTIGPIIHDLCYAMVPNSGYNDPRILLIQETGPAAEDTLLGIRATIESGGPNNWIGLAFPSLKESVIKKTVDKIWISSTGVSKDPSVTAVGVGGAVTGKHPKKLIGDDMVTKENAKTEHLRNEQWQWWVKTVQGMIDPQTEVLIPHTLYYPDDLHMRLQGTKAYKVVEIPAIMQRGTHMRDGLTYDENGKALYPVKRWPTPEDYEVIMSPDQETRLWVRLTEKAADMVELWPCPLGHGNCQPPPGTTDWAMWKAKHFEPEFGGIIHRSLEYIIHEKVLGDAEGFASQFMHEFVSFGEKRIDISMMRFYSWEEEDIGKPAAQFGWDVPDRKEYRVVPFPGHDGAFVRSSHAWDHAIGKKARNDRTANARVFKTDRNDVYFIFKYGRWGFVDVYKMMASIYRTEPYLKPPEVVTEGIGFQEAYGEMVRETEPDIIPVKTLKSAVDKDIALTESGLLNHMKQGKCYFDVRDKEAIKELCDFPAGRHDDIVDAARMGFKEINTAEALEAKVYRPSRRSRS